MEAAHFKGHYSRWENLVLDTASADGWIGHYDGKAMERSETTLWKNDEMGTGASLTAAAAANFPIVCASMDTGKVSQYSGTVDHIGELFPFQEASSLSVESISGKKSSSSTLCIIHAFRPP